MEHEDPATQAASDAVDRHKELLLRREGVTAVSVALVVREGRTTDRVGVRIYVRPGASGAAAKALPAELDGLPVSVVERDFDLRPANVDPHILQDPLFCGVAITPRAAPAGLWGSLGCIIHTSTGKHGAGLPNGGYPAGNYFLTNQHVIQGADPRNPNNNGDTRVIQPDSPNVQPPPANLTIGSYADGYLNATNDCAIGSLNGNRAWANMVPKAGLNGFDFLTGVVAPAVGMAVHKFGAATRYTAAVVTDVNFNGGGIQNGTYIENAAHTTWVDGGDSGSVVVRSLDFRGVALNFRDDHLTPVVGGQGFYAGIAYDLQTQMNNFRDPGGVVTLAFG
jgi:hypothetical protein